MSTLKVTVNTLRPTSEGTSSVKLSDANTDVPTGIYCAMNNAVGYILLIDKATAPVKDDLPNFGVFKPVSGGVVPAADLHSAAIANKLWAAWSLSPLFFDPIGPVLQSQFAKITYFFTAA